jgi:hypothetical protein
MIFNVNSISEMNQLFVSNTFNLQSSVILKLGPNFSPNIGDQLNIVPSAADFIINGNFILIGGPSKTKVDWIVQSGLNSAPYDEELNSVHNLQQLTSKQLKIQVTYFHIICRSITVRHIDRIYHWMECTSSC